MGCIALVRCVLVLRCGLAGVVWCGIRMQAASGASDIKLVYRYSTIKMMHGPINIRFLQFLTKPYKILRNPTKPYKSMQNLTKPYKAMQNLTKPYKTSLDF